MRDSRGHNVPSDAVHAIGRFNPDSPTGYRAREPFAVNAPIRPSRDEAFSDIPHDCPWINGCRCHRAVVRA